MEKPIILVLEDVPLIAIDIESSLIDAGCDVVSAGSVMEAESFLQHSRPDAAVVDVGLADGDSVSLVSTLVALSVPFIVHSGTHIRDRHEIFGRGVSVEKPASSVEVARAVKGLLATGTFTLDD